MRNMFKVMGAAASAVAALVVAVQAHTKLEKAEPADKATIAKAPAHIQLTFNEALDVRVSRIELAGATGAVKLGPVHAMNPKTIMAAVDGSMAEGDYTVD